MKNKWKKLLAGMLTGTIMFLTACGGTASGGGSGAIDGGTGTPPAAGVIEIEYWHAMGGSRGEATDVFVKNFNETVGKDEGINVTAVYQGNEIMSKIKMASQENGGKNMPDVSQTVGFDIPTSLQIKNMVLAEDLIASANSNISKKDFPESMLRAFTYQDKLVGLPMNNSAILLYYNIDMFEEAGLTEPPKTIAQLAEYAEKLTVMNGDTVERYGLESEVGRYFLINFITSQFPDSYVGDNEGGRTNPMTKVTMGEDGTLNKFLTEWQKLIKLPGYKAVADSTNEEFAAGQHAMVIMSSSRISTTEQLGGEDFNFGVTYLPKVNENDTSGSSVGGSCLIAYDNGEARLQAAWKFMEFATSAETQATWSQASGYMPTNVNSYELDSMKEFYKNNPRYYVPYLQMMDSDPKSQEPFDLVGTQANTIITEVMEKFASGELSLEQTEEQIISRYNEAIEEYNRANN